MRPEFNAPKLQLRAWIPLLLSIVAAQVLWPTLQLQLRRQSLHLRAGVSSYSGELLLHWRDAEGRPQGRWVFTDSWEQLPRELIIEVPQSSADQPTEFHLYEIRMGGHRLIPRVAGPSTGPTESVPSLSGNWTQADGDKGLFFRGPESGSLRLQLPPTLGTPDLITESTRTGGPVRTIFAGIVVDRTCRAEQWTQTTWTLNGGTHDAPLQDIDIALPAYQVSGLELCRIGEGQGVLDVQAAELRHAFAGLEWTVPASSAPVHMDAGGVLPLAASAPVSLRVTIGLCRFVFTIALALLGAVIGPAMICRAGAGSARTMEGSRGLFWLALVTLVGVRLWLALSTPVIMLPDGVEYAINAERLLETGSFDHFDAWRQPGPSLFLAPFFAISSRGEALACLAQAGGGVLISVLVYRLLCPLVGSRWSTAAMLLTGLDPAVLSWERFILSESLAATLIVVWWWCLSRLIRASTPRAAFVCAVSAGLLAGLACLVRSNAVLLVGIGPVAVIFAGGQRSARSRLGSAGACVLVSLIPLLPQIIHNARRYDTPAPFVGAGFARCIFHWYADAIDPNQSQFVSNAQARTLVQAREQHVSEFVLLHALSADAKVPSPPPTRAEWTELDAVADRVVQESRAREPAKVLHTAGLAALSHLGIWRDPRHTSFDSTRTHYARLLCAEPVDGAKHNWFRPASAEDVSARDRLWRVGTSARYEPHILAVVEQRTLDTRWPERRPLASRALGWWWGVFSAIIRPALGCLFLLGCAVAWRERQATILVAGAVVILTTVALSWLLLCGEARYTDPLHPMLICVACFGLARAAQWIWGGYFGAAGLQKSRFP